MLDVTDEQRSFVLVDCYLRRSGAGVDDQNLHIFGVIRFEL